MRDKEHSAEPMTVDQALYQMELVGHDFYLFLDAGMRATQRGLSPQGLRLRRHLTHLWKEAPRGV